MRRYAASPIRRGAAGQSSRGSPPWTLGPGTQRGRASVRRRPRRPPPGGDCSPSQAAGRAAAFRRAPRDRSAPFTGASPSRLDRPIDDSASLRPPKRCRCTRIASPDAEERSERAVDDFRDRFDLHQISKRTAPIMAAGPIPHGGRGPTSFVMDATADGEASGPWKILRRPAPVGRRIQRRGGLPAMTAQGDLNKRGTN